MRLRIARELKQIVLGVAGMVVVSAAILFVDGEAAIPALRRFGLIFGGFLAVATTILLVFGYVAYREQKRISRRAAKRTARLTVWPEAIVRSFVQDLTPVGFLGSSYGESEDERVANAIERLGRRYDPEAPRDDRVLNDQIMLAWLDPDAFMWIDLERDVCDVNHCYMTWFRELEGISAGAFRPRRLREDWDSSSGPILVQFLLNGKNVSVAPIYIDDWIDLSVLSQLNDLIQGSGRRFEVVTRTDQTACILCLTIEQKVVLTNRGWSFESKFQTHREPSVARGLGE